MEDEIPDLMARLRAPKAGKPVPFFTSGDDVAISAGALLAVVTGPGIGAQHGPLPVVWAATAGMIAVAALWTSTMEVLTGAWNFVPTFGFLMVVGIQSSGGAVSPPLLPAFYSFLAQVLPASAAVGTIRNALYFRDAQKSEPVIVLAAWIVGLLAALLLAVRLRGRTPGGQPYRRRRAGPESIRQKLRREVRSWLPRWLTSNGPAPGDRE